jgi:hypothetical protein
MQKTPLCEFNEVKLNIPRLKLLKLYFKKGLLKHDEKIFLKALSWQVEHAIYKLEHIQSIAEKVLLKG